MEQLLVNSMQCRIVCSRLAEMTATDKEEEADDEKDWRSHHLEQHQN